MGDGSDDQQSRSAARRLRVRLRLPDRSGAERALRSAVRHRLEHRAPRFLRAGERRRGLTRRASFRRCRCRTRACARPSTSMPRPRSSSRRTPSCAIGALRLSAAGEYGLDEVTNFATDGVSDHQPGGAVRSQQPGRNLDQPANPRRRTCRHADARSRRSPMSAFAAPWAAPTTARRRWRMPPSSTTAPATTRAMAAACALSHQLTPIVTAFADGSVEYRTYDARVADAAREARQHRLRLHGRPLGRDRHDPRSRGLGRCRPCASSPTPASPMCRRCSTRRRSPSGPTRRSSSSATFASNIEAPGPNGAGTASIERDGDGRGALQGQHLVVGLGGRGLERRRPRSA